jgi:hypothetical protein
MEITMPRPMTREITCSLLALAVSLGSASLAPAQAVPYPNMAPAQQYQMASQAEEIALARSAAPTSIANEAEVLALGAGGYESAVKGKNGFVCLVQRSWASDFSDAEFWNPKERAPICFNPAAVRSVLPAYLKRTEWVLAGASKADLVNRTKAGLAAKQITAPEVGAMAYMMSKGGYLSDSAGGHWHPHLMFFLPRMATSEWGANGPNGAVMGGASEVEPVTTFFVPLPHWSDGDAESMGR